MKKHLFAAMAALALVAFPVAGAMAQDLDGDNDVRVDTDNDYDIRPYVGVGLGAFGLEEKEPGFSQKSTVFGGYGKLGADIGDYLGIEFRVGATGSDTQSNAAGVLGSPVPFDTKLTSDYFLSYLGKLQLPVTPDLRLYAMLGGTTAKFKTTVSLLGVKATASSTKTGFSYGVGAEYSLQDTLSVGVEWMQYWTNVNIAAASEAKIWGAVATAAYHF